MTNPYIPTIEGGNAWISRNHNRQIVLGYNNPGIGNAGTFKLSKEGLIKLLKEGIIVLGGEKDEEINQANKSR